MTYNEAYDMIDDLLDKQGSVYFTSTEKVRFLELAVNEFIKERASIYESNISIAHDLSTQVKTYIWDLATDTLGTISDDLLYKIVRSEIVDASDVFQRNAEYVEVDKVNQALDNPFRKPEDGKYSIFWVADNKLNALGLATGEKVKITYIGMVELGSPSGTDELPLAKHTHEDVVNICVRKMMSSIGNVAGYQLQQAEIKEKLNP